MNSYAARLASFTSWPHVYPSASTVARAGFHREFDPTFPSPDLTLCSLCGLDPCNWDGDNPFDFHAIRSPECPFVRAIQQKKKHRNQKTRQQYTRRSLQATQPAHQSTQQATQPEHSVEQEEEIQQANAENAAEIPSDNKATIIKNTAQLSTIPRHMLSTVPRQITTQQAENDTAIWPIIPTVSVWHITAMSTQEKDLLRRSQPIGPLQEDIGRCIFGRIEIVRCLALIAISKGFTAAGELMGCTPLISPVSPFLSGVRKIMHAYFLP